MTDQTSIEKEAGYISHIETDLRAAVSASQDLRRSNVERAASLTDDVMFYLNELFAVAVHTRNDETRRACAAIIGSLGLDSSGTHGFSVPHYGLVVCGG